MKVRSLLRKYTVWCNRWLLHSARASSCALHWHSSIKRPCTRKENKILIKITESNTVNLERRTPTQLSRPLSNLLRDVHPISWAGHYPTSLKPEGRYNSHSNQTTVSILNYINSFFFFCCSTVHFDKYQSFLWPTNAHFINIKMLKLTIKTFV
jgi:hypothetical protein